MWIFCLSVPTAFYTLPAVVEVSFSAQDFPGNEGDREVTVELNVNRAQRPYTITLRPVTIDEAIMERDNDAAAMPPLSNLNVFLEGLVDNIEDVSKATPYGASKCKKIWLRRDIELNKVLS